MSVGIVWLVACTPPEPTTKTHTAEPTVTIPVAPFVPQIAGGEMLLGSDGQMLVTVAPAGALVELFRGTHQGPGPCAFDLDPPAGPCAGIVDPSLVATAAADETGAAAFVLPAADFDEPQEMVMQAKVTDPVDPRLVAYTEAVVRHVSIPVEQAPVRFTKATLQARLTDTFTLGNSHTGGVAFVDVNNDYLPDLYIVSGAGVHNHLYLNQADQGFLDVSERVMKVAPALECAGVTYGDIDNDGDLDLMVPVDNSTQMQSSVSQPVEGGPNQLYLNDGTGHFDEVGESAGVVDPLGYRNSNASFADYDRDGCLDLYVERWAMAAAPGGDNFDRMLHGNCDGTFTDVSADLGLDPLGRDGLGLLWFDADLDGWPDLYVANDSDRDEVPVFDPNDDFWRNEGGHSFENWIHKADPTVGYDGWAAMGMDVGDIDGDGDWDLYITDVWELPPTPHGNVLYLNNGDGTFGANACQEKGVCFGYNSWPTNFMDFDNDGWVDLWVGASIGADPDILYINRADGTGEFDPVRVLGWSGYTARAGTAADFDADGDVDVFIWDDGGDSSLWRNELDNDGHWLQLRLIGTDSNRAAIGARVEVTTGGRTVLGKVSGGDSAHSQTDLTVHLGLGGGKADQTRIFWPSGAVSELGAVDADRFWLVDEGQGLIDDQLIDPTATWSVSTSTLTVTTTTRYVGRSHVMAVDLGSLSYTLDLRGYTKAFALTARPDEVVVQNTTGQQAAVTVTDVP